MSVYLEPDLDTETFSRSIVIDFANCHMGHAYHDGEDTTQWVTTCSEEELARGRELASAELVARYQEGTAGVDGRGHEPHCYFAFYVPPALVGLPVGLSTDVEYPEEVVQMRDFFVGLAAKYDAPP